MEKMSDRATTAFCPPESCFIVLASPAPKETRTCTAWYFSTERSRLALSGTVPSATGWSLFLIMTSSPLPLTTISLKISLKCMATPRKVRSMSSSFLRSSPSISSRILSLLFSTSACRRFRSSRCSVNCRNWSSAFLLTWENFLKASLHCCSMRCSSLAALPLYLSKALEGSDPSSRIFFCRSSRFCSSRLRLPISCSISFASSCSSCSSASCTAFSSSSCALNCCSATRCSCTFRSFSWKLAVMALRLSATCWRSACRAFICSRRVSRFMLSSSASTSSLRRSRFRSRCSSSLVFCVSCSIRSAWHRTCSVLRRWISGLRPASSSRCSGVRAAMKSTLSSSCSSSICFCMRAVLSCALRSSRSFASSCACRYFPLSPMSATSALSRSSSLFARARSLLIFSSCVITRFTSCSTCWFSALNPCASSRAALIFPPSSLMLFMYDSREYRRSWYPPVSAPRLFTWSPSMVTQSSLVERDMLVATSRLRQSSTLPKIW
mmetsp:Transcript_30826/g.67304  ORF Transcript_30826/g.67304 Transcript_30826/m.67304 type:complete len:495 (+) Transcript_30826:554-2038(+)